MLRFQQPLLDLVKQPQNIPMQAVTHLYRIIGKAVQLLYLDFAVHQSAEQRPSAARTQIIRENARQSASPLIYCYRLRFTLQQHIFLVCFHLGQPLFANRNTLFRTIVIPYRAKWIRFELFRQSKTRRVVAFQLGFFSASIGSSIASKQRFDRIARSDYPGRDTINAGIEEIESDMRLAQQITANELACQFRLTHHPA